VLVKEQRYETVAVCRCQVTSGSVFPCEVLPERPNTIERGDHSVIACIMLALYVVVR